MLTRLTDMFVTVSRDTLEFIVKQVSTLFSIAERSISRIIVG